MYKTCDRCFYLNLFLTPKTGLTPTEYNKTAEYSKYPAVVQVYL